MDTSTLLSTLLVLICTSLQVHGEDRLQCFECKYFKVESDTAYISTFLSFISRASNEHCKFEKAGDDEEVGRKYCPTPGADEESKCIIVKGEVEGDLDLVLGSVDVKYRAIARSCVTVKKGEVRDGCVKELPSNAAVRKILDSSLKNTKFNGESCYYSYTAGAMETAGRINLGFLILCAMCAMFKFF